MPTLFPATRRSRLFGQVATLNQAGLGTADWVAVSTGQFRHTYDLQTQDKAVVESQFNYYATRQFQLQAANVALIDFTTGPRFQAFRETFEDVIVRPFVSSRIHPGQRYALLRQLWRRGRDRRAAFRRPAQRLDLQLAPAELSLHLVPADQQPVNRHAVLGHHHLPILGQSAGLPVHCGQRPALPDAADAAAELHAPENRGGLRLPLHRSTVPLRPAVDD